MIILGEENAETPKIHSYSLYYAWEPAMYQY